jgi:hypothetical protein
MLDTNEFVAIGDAEGAEIVGGWGVVFFLLKYLVDNAGEIVAGVKEGYAAGGSPHPA